MAENPAETFDPSELQKTYVEMIDAYVASQAWIGSAELPLVFHARKLAQQLDHDLALTSSTQAAKDSAYLQAIERLNKRKPVETVTKTTTSQTSQIDGQTDVFEFLD